MTGELVPWSLFTLPLRERTRSGVRVPSWWELPLRGIPPSRTGESTAGRNDEGRVALQVSTSPFTVSDTALFHASRYVNVPISTGAVPIEYKCTATSSFPVMMRRPSNSMWPHPTSRSAVVPVSMFGSADAPAAVEVDGTETSSNISTLIRTEVLGGVGNRKKRESLQSMSATHGLGLSEDCS